MHGAMQIVAVLIFNSSCSIAVRASIISVNGTTYATTLRESVTMNCLPMVDTYTEVYSIQWLFMNRTVPSGVTFNGTTNETLIILSLSYLHHLGEYFCIVTSSSGQQFASNTITLIPSEFKMNFSCLQASTIKSTDFKWALKILSLIIIIIMIIIDSKIIMQNLPVSFLPMITMLLKWCTIILSLWSALWCYHLIMPLKIFSG